MPFLVLLGIIINVVQGFHYDHGAVLTNVELNMVIVLSILMGLLSLALSYWPNVVDDVGDL